MEEHTTPYRLEEILSKGKLFYRIYNKNKDIYSTKSIVEAKFIVKACNNHDTLLKECKSALIAIEGALNSKYNTITSLDIQLAPEYLKKAIKQAESFINH